MEHALFKLLILVGMFVVWVVRRIRAAAEQPAPSAMAAPAVLPRRVRPRGRPVAKPPVLPDVPPPAPANPPAVPLVVTRPARAAVRLQFQGRAALRRAFVAQEVLGPPLALRPPRV